MVIVAGHLIVGREQRDPYLAGCEVVVEQADMIVSASVSEFEISAERRLT